MPDPIHKLSADAALLSQRLAKVAVGETISYAELSTVVSRSVTAAFPALRTALHIVLRDHDMVFDCIRTKGFKRLADGEIVKSGSRDAEKIRRASKRAVTKQTKVDFAKLTNPEKLRYSAQISTMATIATMTKPSSIAKLEASITPQRDKLPIKETLQMFARSVS